MAWDSTKVDGVDQLTGAEWNTHVTDQKGHASRHNLNGVDALSFPFMKIISYVGNNSQNRAIAHGLGYIPKGVMIFCDNLNDISCTWSGSGTTYYLMGAGGTRNMTAPDGTNVYVGQASPFATNVNTYNYVLYVW